MDAVTFVSRYRKSLKTRIEDISISLSSGHAADMEQYRAMVGEIQGLTYALDEMDSLLKKDSDDDFDRT
jgi:hypothetical protein